MMKRRFFLVSSVFSFFIILSQLVYALDSSDQNSLHIKNKKAILRMSQEMAEIEQKIVDGERMIELSSSDRMKRLKEKELEELYRDFNKIKERFLSTAAAIDIGEGQISEVSKQKRNFLDELQNLLWPFVDSLQRASARPRKIEGFKREIELLNEKIKFLEHGIENLIQWEKEEEGQNATPNGPLMRELKRAKEILNQKLGDIRFQQEEINRSLHFELSQGKSLKDTSSELLKSFFGQRGKNFLLAIFTFIFGCWAVLRLKKYEIPERFIRQPQLQWIKRPLRLLHNLLAFIIAFALSLLVLYLLNDWALLTFFTLILLSIIWSLKQMAPKFINEARFLLNLGNVKEGERIIWKGIPWKVETLGPTSILVNERLEGGKIRVSSKDLSLSYSRPLVEGEVWFPSQKGDLVELSQDLYGEITIQTPEQVVLKNWDGRLKYFHTTDFLSLAPVNLSGGHITISEKFYFSFDLCRPFIAIFKEIEELMESSLSQSQLFSFTTHAGEKVELILRPWIELLPDPSYGHLIQCSLLIPGKLALQKSLIRREMVLLLYQICDSKGLKPPKLLLSLSETQNRE